MTSRDFWRAFTIGFLACAALCVGIFSMQERVTTAAIDKLEAQIQARDTTIARLRLREAEALRIADSLRKNAIKSGAQFQERAQLLVIDTTLPTPSLVTSIDADTTRMGSVRRLKGDLRPYPVPMFFIDTYSAAKSAYDDEKSLRVYTETYVVGMKDHLIKELSGDVDDWKNLAGLWEKKANPTCGTKCKLVAGAAIGEGARRLVKGWLDGQR